ncbi:unnamed protein product [Spirodela intermedia]|uniref:glutathione transferase n=1 Tax=Spirodela intermedia TaxID=51605 RepID=A0A7I8IGQ6_SPIIN|nr:unnamed protein product [Spirodela intermedia]CAA6656042.1 unnamed protein product [Spirodela intermedia]
MSAPSVNVYYTKPIMPDVSRVLACLYEKKIDFEHIDIYEGQHSVSGDLLKLRSRASSRIHGAAIEDGDTRLFESRAICRYLAEKYSSRGSRLLGRDPLERAAIEQWLKFEEQRFDPPSWELAFYLGFAAAPPDRAAMRDGVRKLSEVLDVYEQRLGESEFLAGDEFTMADLFHLPNSHHLVVSGLSHSAHPEVSELFSSRRNVRRWWEAISGRPSWKNVVDLLNGVPVQRTSLLAGAPDNGHGWGPRFTEATASPSANTGAGSASQQPLLPPPSQPKSTKVRSTNGGNDPARPASQQPDPQQRSSSLPPENKAETASQTSRRPQVNGAEAAPQAGNNRSIQGTAANGATLSSPETAGGGAAESKLIRLVALLQLKMGKETIPPLINSHWPKFPTVEILGDA